MGHMLDHLTIGTLPGRFACARCLFSQAPLDQHLRGNARMIHARISELMKRFGDSCDWSRERFTLSPEPVGHILRPAFKEPQELPAEWAFNRLLPAAVREKSLCFLRFFGSS